MKKIIIDTREGGRGDVWMRLVSLYTLSKLNKDTEISVCVPKFINTLAKYVFSDRIKIIEQAGKADIKYTNLGLKHLYIRILKGEALILPYQRTVYYDKKEKKIKDHINKKFFDILNAIGVVQIPEEKWLNYYQGFTDVVGIKEFKSTNYDKYIEQLYKDAELISQKINGNVPISEKLRIPEDIKERIVVFPTGTSRQFIPELWAKQNLPSAYFAFFYKDKDAELFIKNGLDVIYFFEEPGDIIKLSLMSKWTISTDSFPSHLIQSSNNKSTILITEVLRSRIINPTYKGCVVDAVAACHPCLKKEKKRYVYCSAGYEFCINWNSSLYKDKIIESILMK